VIARLSLTFLPPVDCKRTTIKSMSTSGTSSSKAGSHFGLDENGSKPILVYKYRSGAKGLEVKTERDLCEELDQGKSLAQSSEAFV
jgi:hypothetical protein